MRVRGYFLKKRKLCMRNLTKERKQPPATRTYSAVVDFLEYVYSVLVTENHLKSRSRCLVHEFSFTEHGYRASFLKKSSLWLLPSYMAVATYWYYQKLRRMMRTGTALYLLNLIIFPDFFRNFPQYSNDL